MILMKSKGFVEFPQFTGRILNSMLSKREKGGESDF